MVSPGSLSLDAPRKMPTTRHKHSSSRIIKKHACPHSPSSLSEIYVRSSKPFTQLYKSCHRILFPSEHLHPHHAKNTLANLYSSSCGSKRDPGSKAVLTTLTIHGLGKCASKVAELAWSLQQTHDDVEIIRTWTTTESVLDEVVESEELEERLLPGLHIELCRRIA